LYPYQFLETDDGNYQLILQGDSNLVLYYQGRAIWTTNTAGRSAASLVMQSDGNLVLYNTSGAALWSSGTYGNPGAYLTLQSDGNLVIYSSSGAALWDSRTVNIQNYLVTYNTIQSSGILYPNKFLETDDGNYQLILQGDSNLVLYYQGRAIWTTNTAGRSAASLVMQSDGNLVLYNTSGAALWSSGTYGQGTSQLILQNDGNLVIYNSSDKPTWVSNTAGGS
jgi:hypothetical protein